MFDYTERVLRPPGAVNPLVSAAPRRRDPGGGAGGMMRPAAAPCYRWGPSRGLAMEPGGPADDATCSAEQRGRLMKRLFLGLCFLVLVFATSMSFISLGVYDLEWWWAAVGVGILVVFVALGGLIVPPARKTVPEADQQTGGALLQAFGALCAMLF